MAQHTHFKIIFKAGFTAWTHKYTQIIIKFLKTPLYRGVPLFKKADDSMDFLKQIINDNVKQEFIEARQRFWSFSSLLYPKFYKEDREFLIELCDVLQAFYENRIILTPPETEWKIVDSLEGLKNYVVCENLMINIPPRHGKSFTATNFAKWILGKDNSNKIITVSYNEKLSGRFAKAVRDGIDELKVEPGKIVYSDIFPNTKIKQGDAANQMWSLEGQFFNYLATSPTGTVTGVGCNIGIIDDIIKDKYEAYNDNILENHWDWYTNTFLSRLEEGAKQIVIMTRWSTKDLCGKILAQEPEQWYVFKRKAYDEATDKMLCPPLLSKKSYMNKKSKTDIEIVEANYNQNPIDIKNRLYTSFKTYTDLPRDANGNLVYERIISYTDTADEGNDNLLSIAAAEYQGEAYVLDVYYTKDPMEITEPKTADMLVRNDVNYAKIESNNGGKGFARNVERNIWEKYKSKKITIEWFHQSQNKIARILSNSSFVMEHIYFPQNWKDKWPRFYYDMTTYQRGGKNKHDDAPDGVTGLAEMVTNDNTRTRFRWL